MIYQKPKIFVSSTIRDLPSERKAAERAIGRIGAIPIMSEVTMPAENKDSVSACLDQVISCDIYILIIGSKYGWQPNGQESITELEYITAKKHNKLILVFIMPYEKEELQQEFIKRVESKYFRKTVSDAFQLETEIYNSLENEIEKKEKEYFEHKELIYSNLVRINFPDYLNIAQVTIDKDQIKREAKLNEVTLYEKPDLFNYAVTLLKINDLSFPHDWLIYKKMLVTFHDLEQKDLPLQTFIDEGTIEKIQSDFFYQNSESNLYTFKSLLRKCLSTKFFKMGIHWYPDRKVFAFMPVSKDKYGKWKSREIEWNRKKKASRTVADITYSNKNPDEIFKTKHLAFKADFHLLDGNWYLAIKPEWLITFSNDFIVSEFGYSDIQWLKRNERNKAVFNHLNFILHYLQPSSSQQLFDKYQEYPFLKIKNMIKFEGYPRIHDQEWHKKEKGKRKKALRDSKDNVDLFTV